MAWSYGGDPSKSLKDAVRFEIGDTEADFGILSDEEIAYVLTLEPNALSAAARCCEVITRKLAKDPNMSIGKTKIDNASATAQYLELARDLRKRANMLSSGFGIANIPLPTFDRGMHDNYKA